MGESLIVFLTYEAQLEGHCLLYQIFKVGAISRATAGPSSLQMNTWMGSGRIFNSLFNV